MLSGEALLVLNECPDLFVCQHPAEANHGRTRRPKLDHPEDFPLRTMAPKSMVTKIPRGGIQRCRDGAITCSALTVTIDASSLSLIERFSLGEDLRRILERAHKSFGFRQLVARDPRLHHVLLRSSRERHDTSADEP
jgi:hypothetical protein